MTHSAKFTHTLHTRTSYNSINYGHPMLPQAEPLISVFYSASKTHHEIVSFNLVVILCLTELFYL